MKEFLSWLSNFDALKAIFLAIVAVLGSWYDLKGTVEQNRLTAQASVQQLKSDQEWSRDRQAIIDAYQTETITQLKKDITDGFKDLKGEFRASRPVKQLP